MIAESMIDDADVVLSSVPGSGASWWNSASEISAAAPPPTPLKSATICGIAVIRTLRARDRAERAADRSSPTMISQ